MPEDYSPEELARRLAQCRIPSHMHYAIVEYILHGHPVGHFLTAVFTNDLKEACGRADEENQKILYQYIFFLYNYAPGGCWGSPEKFAAWQLQGGLEGVMRLAKESSTGANRV